MNPPGIGEAQRRALIRKLGDFRERANILQQRRSDLLSRVESMRVQFEQARHIFEQAKALKEEFGKKAPAIDLELTALVPRIRELERALQTGTDRALVELANRYGISGPL